MRQPVAARQHQTHVETANERMKRESESWLPRAIVAAVVVHFALFAFWPDMMVADINGERNDDFIVIPPTLDLPQPPEQIQRPALPQVSTSIIDDDITIPPTDYSHWTPDRLTPPTAQASERALEEFIAFAPTMVPPRLLNTQVVERALQQNYPTLLREAGVGGTVEVSLWLDVDGAIVRSTISRSSGYPAFDQAALRVVDVMRLTPAISMNTPTRVVVTLPIVFTVK